MDKFRAAVDLVAQQDQVPLYEATVWDVNRTFIASFRKAERTQDAEAMGALVADLPFFMAEQANTIPAMANHSKAIADALEQLGATLAKTVKDRSLIPEDFMLCLLKG